MINAITAGVTGIIVDWEFMGKESRQTGADTQINRDTFQDLLNVRSATGATVLCRINGYGSHTLHEVSQVIDSGADEILLPMVRAPFEIEEVLKIANGQVGVGILVETVAATKILDKLEHYPLSRVYVGLNDLGIERHTPNIFTPLVDGLLDQIREHFRHLPFGFAGLTDPDAGYPIPCRLLVGEMARLDANFSFLRRSFYRDTVQNAWHTAVPRIYTALTQAHLRTPEQVKRDREELFKSINAWNIYSR